VWKANPRHLVSVCGKPNFAGLKVFCTLNKIPKAASISPKVGLKELAQFKQIPDMATVKVPLHYVKVTGIKEFKATGEMSSRKLIPKAASIASKKGIAEMVEFK
jgi:hypothetical protein